MHVKIPFYTDLTNLFMINVCETILQEAAVPFREHFVKKGQLTYLYIQISVKTVIFCLHL